MARSCSCPTMKSAGRGFQNPENNAHNSRLHDSGKPDSQQQPHDPRSETRSQPAPLINHLGFRIREPIPVGYRLRLWRELLLGSEECPGASDDGRVDGSHDEECPVRGNQGAAVVWAQTDGRYASRCYRMERTSAGPAGCLRSKDHDIHLLL